MNSTNVEEIYKDENILVLNKPAGLVVHFDGKTEEKTLADFVLENYPEMGTVGESMFVKDREGKEIEIIRPGIVHRLDRETSGVIVLARNQESFEFLKNAFKEREMEKTYNTFVWGNVKEDKGLINAPIGKSKKDFRQWSAQRGARGEMRDAITKYVVLDRFTDEGENFSYLEVMPKTGRTHQIRVHMKYLNHPVVGDKLYAPKRPMAISATRVMLHARKIVIPRPNGDNMEFEASLPDDFKYILNRLN